MPRWIAPIVLVGMAAALFLAMPARVAACDCALIEPTVAARDADVVFVGTLVGAGNGGKPVPGGVAADTAWTFAVELSRSADDPASITVMAPLNDGANCGVSFGTEERWLVMASAIDGVLRTSSCSSNTPADTAEGAYAEVIGGLVPIGSDASSTDGGLSLPMPLLLVLGSVALIAVVSAVAFRERVS
jgi:hypothetical protein